MSTSPISDSWAAVIALRRDGILDTIGAQAIDATPFIDGWMFCAMAGRLFHLIAMTKDGRCYHIVTTTLQETISRWWLDLAKRPLQDHTLRWYSEGAWI